MSLLEISHVTGGYTRTPVLKDVSFEVKPNELVALIGLNGAGKSTIIKHIIGLMNPRKGDIKINNKKFSEDMEAYRKQFSFIMFFYNCIFLINLLHIVMNSFSLDYLYLNIVL